jgi:hypothetical protein
MKEKTMKAFCIKLLLPFFILLLITCTFHHKDGSPVQQDVITQLLDDFENPQDTAKWTGPVSRSKEFPAHGSAGLRLEAPEGQPVWLESRNLPKDWSSFDLLKFDIYNPSVRLYYGTLQLFDDAGTDEQAEFQGQSYRGEDKLFLNTGWNHFEFRIKRAMVEEGDRPLSLQKIRKMRFSFGSTDKPMYVDNIRLVKGEENAKTQSGINPMDCRVVIDNREVFAALAGPLDKIRTGPEIIQLRKQALNACNDLKKAVGIAELQGFQTLYQRIPLITADVGMGIRNKLVWFQNETEEKKILYYVISSCNKASGEISDLISGSQNKLLSVEPENDVANASFYVPPYPPMDELHPMDGVYRDKDGNPVILFSMLQVNKGPLMDYFAPFNHRIESYTVGGGSRYNIESSPVYEAFHKYNGTHRVGWDGWCGHLIKDRWSMGGGTHGLLLQFLHGKADISKWWWAVTPSKEFPHMNETSLPHSKEILLSDIDEVLRLGLDVRRLASEIAAFTGPDPEVAILYSKSSILQVPPGQIQSGVTPYLNALYSVWSGSQYLGCRIGFVTENQILSGRLSEFKLLLVPAAKYIRPEIVTCLEKYIENGGTAVVIPESFVFDQYARENNRIKDFGIGINGVTLPPVLGKAEKIQNYDQSFSQAVLYGEVSKKITCPNNGLFAGNNAPVTLNSDGLVQSIDPGNNITVARFDDGKPAIVQVLRGKGSLYYLAAPLKTADYHLLLSPLATHCGIHRPALGIGRDGKPVTGAEVRSVDRGKDILVYACNLTQVQQWNSGSSISQDTGKPLIFFRTIPKKEISLKHTSNKFMVC